MPTLHYCKKCGRIVQNSNDIEKYACDCCGHYTCKVPDKYLNEKVRFLIKNDECEKQLIEECVKTAPEFDQYLFDHRDEILSRQSAEFQEKLAIGRAIIEGRKYNPAGVSCTYCKSTNVKKISAASKAGSVALFGIFSQKVHKQWHCNSCGSDF